MAIFFNFSNFIFGAFVLDKIFWKQEKDGECANDNVEKSDETADKRKCWTLDQFEFFFIKFANVFVLFLEHSYEDDKDDDDYEDAVLWQIFCKKEQIWKGSEQ